MNVAPDCDVPIQTCVTENKMATGPCKKEINMVVASVISMTCELGLI